MNDNLLNSCKGFDWDLGNTEKNQKKHHVSQSECEQIFFNDPVLIYDDKQHSQIEPRYFALGQTDLRRMLMLVFTIRQDLIRVISARPMSKKERGHYEKTEEDS